jgi:fused signal recognition particle receptor
MRTERRPPSPSPLVAQQLIRPEDIAVRAAPAPREGAVIRPLQAPSVAQARPRPSAPSGGVAQPSAPQTPALVPVQVPPKVPVHAVDATPPSAAQPAMRDARPTPLLSLEAATERTREVSPALTAIAKQEPPPAAPQALKPPAASAPPVVAFDARAPEKPATLIEIGAVEVRLAPVEPRPRRAAAPAERRGRGFVYPFGFRQG